MYLPLDNVDYKEPESLRKIIAKSICKAKQKMDPNDGNKSHSTVG